MAATPEFANPVYILPGGGAGNTRLWSAAEDCSTGIALAAVGSAELYLADLSQATFTSGSPAGSWTAPQQFLSVPEFNFLAYNGALYGTEGLAVAPGSQLAIVTGTFCATG